jgi:hypothetical protein
VNLGQVRADGAIQITARDDLNAGTVSATGDAGAGGVIRIAVSQSYIDTAAAQTTARGTAAGGAVVVDAGSSGRLFSSGRFDATGASGGAIDLLGKDVLLVGATLEASGSAGGGRVMVWSQASTDFAGSISAAGGAQGGFIEVSSHGTLTDAGKADAGPGGTLVLDPTNLVVSAAPTGVFPLFNLVNPGSGGTFGSQVVTLSTGNIVVTDSTVNSTGAVYLFNGQTGALISALTGTSGAVKALPSGNFVVDNPSWNGKRGAVTWISGTAGLNGTVSTSNSLVGSNAGNLLTGDQVGGGTDPSTGVASQGVSVLPNGNYLVFSPLWNGKRGAVTWGSGTAGVTGTISAANSLIGGGPGDAVGGRATTFVSGVTALPNGNYVVVSPDFGGGKGAATWGNGTTGATGIVSSANSLVGSLAGDQVGNSFPNVTVLSNGNYVVNSPDWKGKLGAVTWASGTSGASLDGQHTLDAQNSIEGTVAGAAGSSPSQPAALPGSFVALFPNENGGVVTVGFTDPNQVTPSLAQGQTLSVTPDLLQNTLDAGTAVDLQATDTITIASPVTVSAGGHGGNVTLEDATLLLNANLNTDGGSLTLSGTVKPGAGFVQLSAPTVAFKAHSSYAIPLNGNTAGTGFDQLQVTGTIDLSNAALAVSSAGGFGGGQSFVILTSTQPITTSFAGLPEGSTIAGMTISYKNNQVTLTLPGGSGPTGPGPMGPGPTGPGPTAPGPAAQVSFPTPLKGARAGRFLAPFAVLVVDQNGNPVNGPVTLTVVSVKKHGHARFGRGSVTQVTAVNGVARLLKVSISPKGKYRLIAHAGSVTAESGIFSVK